MRAAGDHQLPGLCEHSIHNRQLPPRYITGLRHLALLLVGLLRPRGGLTTRGNREVVTSCDQLFGRQAGELEAQRHRQAGRGRAWQLLRCAECLAQVGGPWRDLRAVGLNRSLS